MYSNLFSYVYIMESLEWNSKLEQYFVETGEKSYGYSLLHKKGEKIYSRKKSIIDLPVIVLSGITGFLSVGSQSMFGNQNISSIWLGLLSLGISILNTVGSYYNFGQRAEQHRVSCIEYSKLYRELSIQLSIPRKQRITPKELLKYCKDSYERLTEISPLLDKNIIEEFKKQFKSITNIAIPEEANGLHKIDVYIDPNEFQPANLKQSNVKIMIDV